MLSRYLSAVFIYYDEGTGMPRSFRVTTPKGDETLTKLSNMRLNPALSPETFRLQLPGDVWITNRTEQSNN
jgi:outer membrane lipoprotein-sorting protein